MALNLDMDSMNAEEKLVIALAIASVLDDVEIARQLANSANVIPFRQRNRITGIDVYTAL